MSEQTVEGGGGGPVFDDEMAEILDSFIVETREIFERLGQDLLVLEKGSADNELLNSIFRAVHTVKGTSSFLGLEQMTELAHVFEDVLNKLRRGEITVSAGQMDVMFEAYDIMKDLLQRIEAKNLARVDLTDILAKLRVIGQGGMAAPDVPVVVPAAAASPAASPAAVPAAPPVKTPAASPAPAQPAPKAAPQPADAAQREPAAVVTAAKESPQAPAPARQAAASSEQHPAAPAPASGKAADTTIRVDVARLDSLMNLVGELVLGRNRLTQISYQMNQEYETVPITKDLSETSSQIDFITTELQMAVMKTRMVPIAKVFNKLPRMVRDLAKETGKEISLEMFGEDTELDKSIIEELNDPLVHLMRNAADHGLESTADRRAAGKPERGTITVKAAHEGNHIVISVGDDGRGMDPEKLKAKAIEKGMITEAQAKEMPRADAFNLVFAPGFSTAAKVTNVSGRGVGMDVVRTNITKLKGIIEIESELGKGSTIIIKLPLTLAIIQALLVDVAKEVFSVPLESVLEVVRIQPKDINTINGKEVVRLRNTVLPLARLHRIMKTTGNGHGAEEWIYVVVVGLAQQRLGIVVDSLLGQKEVVIKSLGGYLGTVPGIAGSTILGDGRVIMIIDVGEMMKLYAELR
ncbi:MAG: chemotaxis protein CheA [Bacteroidetes bacterium]|nr:chemotaxis protein CheA [Bacteroidota bacterium]